MKFKIIILFLLCSLNFYAQQNSDNYLPLGLENYWELRHNDSSDYVGDVKITVLDSLFINGKTYFVLNNFIPSPVYQDYDTIRIDEYGNLYKLFLGNDMHWFNLSADENIIDTIKFDQPYSDFFYIVSYSINNKVETSAGEYANALKIWIQMDFAISNFKRIYLVNNIGIVALSEIGVGVDGYDYNLYEANINGNLLTDISEKNSLPIEYKLNQNYPNPFNPSTNIRYSIKESGMVSLKVYNPLGEEVADLIHEMKEAGRYSVEFDATRLASGLYIYRLQANDFVETKKMVLLK